MEIRFPDGSPAVEVRATTIYAQPVLDAINVKVREVFGGTEEDLRGAHTDQVPDWYADASAVKATDWAIRRPSDTGDLLELEQFSSDMEGGAPVTDLAALLNQLGAAGWELVDKTTDTAAYMGDHAPSEQFPVRIRLTLKRAAGASQS